MLAGDCNLLSWPCLQAGLYRYRLTAWNAHSWSPYAISEPCSTAQARLPCADAPTCRHLGRDCPEAMEQEAAAMVPSAKVRLSTLWHVQVESQAGRQCSSQGCCMSLNSLSLSCCCNHNV